MKNKQQFGKQAKRLACLLLCAGMTLSTGLPALAAAYERETALVEDMEQKDQNILVSPLSLNMALAMTANGASGSTKQELVDYLGSDLKTYNQFVKKNYSNAEKELKVANSIWLSKDAADALNQTFSSKLKKFYRAKGFRVDFSKKKTVKKINKWVNKNTDGMIPRLLDSTSPSTEAILTNTLYFDANWRKTFSKSLTKKDTFTNSNSKEVQVDFMKGSAEDYFSTDQAEGFSKFYRNGRYEFITVLPKTGNDIDLKELDLENYLASRNSDYILSVSMPKFTFEYTAGKLKDTLKQEGITEAFSDQARLDKIADNKKELHIDDVIQKTKIIVGEDGTKAAAATGVIVGATGVDTRERKSIKLDRPFAFIIYDNAADSILFIGKVNTLK